VLMETSLQDGPRRTQAPQASKNRRAPPFEAAGVLSGRPLPGAWLAAGAVREFNRLCRKGAPAHPPPHPPGRATFVATGAPSVPAIARGIYRTPNDRGRAEWHPPMIR